MTMFLLENILNNMACVVNKSNRTVIEVKDPEARRQRNLMLFPGNPANPLLGLTQNGNQTLSEVSALLNTRNMTYQGTPEASYLPVSCGCNNGTPTVLAEDMTAGLHFLFSKSVIGT